MGIKLPDRADMEADDSSAYWLCLSPPPLKVPSFSAIYVFVYATDSVFLSKNFDYEKGLEEHRSLYRKNY